MGFTEKVAATVTGSLIASTITRKYLTNKVENTKDTILEENQFPNTTILLPTLNDELFVERTLKSIKNQNIYKLYPNRFEILLIDSYSTDKTLDIAKIYVDKIIIMEERNLMKARTIGTDNAKGDMIIFIKAGTIYPINWLNSMLKIYYNDPSVVAVSGPEFHQRNVLIDIYEPVFLLLSKNIISKKVKVNNLSYYKYVNNIIEENRLESIYISSLGKLEENIFGKYLFDPQLIVYNTNQK